MHHLLRNKTDMMRMGLWGLLLAFSLPAAAQRELHLRDHDDKKYYLGIGVLYNMSRFQLSHHDRFLASDTVMMVHPENAGGIGLAGLHTYRLSPRFEVRAIFPQLLFSYKNLTYHLSYPEAALEEQPVMTKRVESILLGLPIHVKFRSDRIDNFRFYVFGGGKFEYDLASNARARRAEDLVKLRKLDVGVEAGLGFNFYFPVFILSPEIKISNGISNSHHRDEGLKFSNVVDRLHSRMIVFSLIFEG